MSLFSFARSLAFFSFSENDWSFFSNKKKVFQVDFKQLPMYIITDFQLVKTLAEQAKQTTNGKCKYIQQEKATRTVFFFFTFSFYQITDRIRLKKKATESKDVIKKERKKDQQRKSKI